MSNEITKPVNGFLSTVKEYSLTPYPPIALSASLFVTPFFQSPPVIIPQAQAQAQAQAAANQKLISKLLPFQGKGAVAPIVKTANPSNISCLLFGSFLGLGSFMIYDHDLVNGSGVVSAWSIMYCIVNARRGLLSLSLWPKWLIGLSCFNAFMYGRTFILGTESSAA